jgi:hypothetical protein
MSCVVRYARDGDFVLVTNNASDFRRLYAAQPLHAGLVISFRPIRNNRTGRIDTALDPDMVYTR